MDLEIFRNLQEQMFQHNPAGSLSDLRKIAGNATENSQIINDLAGYAHLASFNLLREAQDYASKFFKESENEQMYQQVRQLIDFYSCPTIRINRSRLTDKVFRSYCQQNRVDIIRTLQVGIDEIKSCSWVYLVRDSDGMVKIFKEINQYTAGPLAGKLPTEGKLFASLPENEFLPKFLGTVDIDGIKFLKQSVCFGPTVDLNHVLPSEEAKKLILGTVKAIGFLHDNGIAYLDIKPENLICQTGKIILLDLGISQKVGQDGLVDIYLADPRFATPEGTTSLKASMSSDIFQMGVLYHWLLNGKHPFELVSFGKDEPNSNRESALLRYTWPTAVLNYSDLYLSSDNAYDELIKSMLDRKETNRPTAKDLIKELDEQKSYFVTNKWQRGNPREKNTILFPARMGIPHSGHIDYISRLINLGFHAHISIQRAYTLTDRDPIQKFLVLKMVALSLMDLGFVPERDFSFVLTPYPFNRAEMEYHFFNLPQADNLVGVASGNPGVHELFPKWPILDQASVFGTEGQEWEVRSWGEIIRKAIKSGDYATFNEYAASGVEKILSFKEIQKTYAQPQIEYAKTVEVVGIRDDSEIVRGRVFRYQTPEQSLFRHLQSYCDLSVKVEDLYQRDSLIELNGKATKVVYQKTDYNQDLRYESIYFNLI